MFLLRDKILTYLFIDMCGLFFVAFLYVYTLV